MTTQRDPLLVRNFSVRSVLRGYFPSVSLSGLECGPVFVHTCSDKDAVWPLEEEAQAGGDTQRPWELGPW